jgi:prepilin-type N-terminal cleavage/methylation domain-containing protein/prepilin-type processing-associated H-X9-DG protein
MMRRNQCRKGFTLVELLVVIGIIGLLIGILLPAIASVRRSAQTTVCASNMRQLGLGIHAYANRDRGWLPQKGPDGHDSGTDSFKAGNGVVGFNDPSIWFNAIPPLINDRSYYDMLVDDSNGNPAPHPGGKPSVFICPSAGDPGSISNQDRIVGDYYLLYGLDSTGRVKNSTGLVPIGNFVFALNYVWNSKLTHTISGGTDASIKMSDIGDPNTVLMTEKVHNNGEYLDYYVQYYRKNYCGGSGGGGDPFNGTLTPKGYTNNIAQSKADWRRFTTRHNHGGNLLFSDGHVAWFAWMDVQIPPDHMVGGYDPLRSDANQPGVIWSALGPTN